MSRLTCGVLIGVAVATAACSNAASSVGQAPSLEKQHVSERAGDAALAEGGQSDASSGSSYPAPKFPDASPLKWKRVTTSGRAPAASLGDANCAASTSDGAFHVVIGNGDSSGISNIHALYTLRAGAWSSIPIGDLTTRVACSFDSRSSATSLTFMAVSVGPGGASSLNVATATFSQGVWQVTKKGAMALTLDSGFNVGPLSPNEWLLAVSSVPPAVYRIPNSTPTTPTKLDASAVGIAFTNARIDIVDDAQGSSWITWVGGSDPGTNLAEVAGKTLQSRGPAGLVVNNFGHSNYFSSVLGAHVRTFGAYDGNIFFGIAAVSPTDAYWQQVVEPNFDLGRFLVFGENVATGTITALVQTTAGANVVLQGTVQSSIGALCTTSSNCLSGHCTDGVCCESACDGVCEACSADLKLSSNRPAPVALLSLLPTRSALSLSRPYAKKTNRSCSSAINLQPIVRLTRAAQTRV